MIVPLLSLVLSTAQAASAPLLPAPLPPQSLPRSGCAAYLWSVADRRLVAMASADPARLRIALSGKPADYDRQSQSGTGGFGFATSTRYATADAMVTLDMTVTTRADLTDGALVQQATLTIERAGADAIVIPVGGLVGCAPQR